MVCLPSRSRVFASVIGVALVVGCGIAVVRSWPEPGSQPAGSEPGSPAAGDLKAPIGGLIDNRDIPPDSHLGAVQAFVIGVPWADLQPDPSGPIVEGNVIDDALREVRQRKAADPGVDLEIKVRVHAGIHAPEWAKHLGGEPVVIRNPQNGEVGTIGRFWTDEFGQAYANLQAALAQRYDQAPEIREVVISRCTTVFAEPFIRSTGDPANAGALLDAGFTLEADRRCHHAQIEAHRVWQRTRSALSFNPYQVVQRGQDGQAKEADADFTREMMRYCRTVLGGRCVLQNNSIRYPPLETYASMYADMRELGPPLAFQTATRDKVGDLERTLAWAVRQGAGSVEIFVDYEDYYSVDMLAAFDRRLEQNSY